MIRREFLKAALAAPLVTVLPKPKPTGARISVLETDEGYDPIWCWAEDVHIFCNGKKIECVATADSRTGYIQYYDTKVGKMLREMRGKVSIKVNGEEYNDIA